MVPVLIRNAPFPFRMGASIIKGRFASSGLAVRGQESALHTPNGKSVSASLPLHTVFTITGRAKRALILMKILACNPAQFRRPTRGRYV